MHLSDPDKVKYVFPYPGGSSCDQILEKSHQIIDNTKPYIVQMFSKKILLRTLRF